MNRHPDPDRSSARRVSVGGNPFATRRVRPGAVPYVFSDGLTVGDLADRLQRSGWRGQIVGPHGSGKTTLLESLLPACQHALPEIHRVTLHNGQRSWPVRLRDMRRWRRHALIVIDGYEQLSRLSRLWFRCLVRCRHFGLLVTTHRTLGLAMIYKTPVSPEITRQVVRAVTNAEDTGITDHDVQQAHAQHDGNVREVLFELYDLFQVRRRTTGRAPFLNGNGMQKARNQMSS